MGTTENSLPSRIYEENHGNHRFDHNHCAGIGTLICQSMSIKNLYAYTHTGFGCIIRHFQAKGISCVTPEVLDTFLLEQHELFEQGAFSPWKWRLVRGSCELLKHCAEEDSVDMPPLLPWSPNLQRPRQSIEKSKPTAEQLADPENIFVLVWKTNRAMMELGLPDATVRHYREEGLAAILKRQYDVMAEHFSKEILEQAVAEKRAQHEQGKTARTSYQNIRKAAYWLQQMY